MNAARALRTARRRAGLSQTELARRACVDPSMINRIERGKVVPRVDTLERLLASAGATLTVEPRKGAGIELGPIRALLQTAPSERLSGPQLETLDDLCRGRVHFVVVGDAAARLHGAPVDVSVVEIVAAGDHVNAAKLQRVLAYPWTSNLIARTDPSNPAIWQEADELPWLPAPRMRVLNRWLDAPNGFVASIEYLLSTASPERQELLHAVQQETDFLAGFRVYHYPERRELRLPPTPSRYGSRGRSMQGRLSQIDRVGNS